MLAPVLVTLLLLNAPLGQAKVLSAPYKATVLRGYYTGAANCYSTHTVRPSQFLKSTGRFTWSAAAAAWTCANATAWTYQPPGNGLNGVGTGPTSYEDQETQMRIDVPFTAAGASSVAVSWGGSGSFAGNYSASGSCPSYGYNSNGYVGAYGDCWAEAYFTTEVTDAIIDLTNGTWIYATGDTSTVPYPSAGPGYVDQSQYVENQTLIEWYCPLSGSGCMNYNSTTGGPSGSSNITQGPWSFTDYLNYTFVRGDKYYLESSITVNFGAYVTGYPSAYAQASFDLASGSNGIYLNSITT